MMQHEKIIKRPDGSRIRIKACLVIDFRGFSWSYSVDFCAKRKRTWVRTVDTDSFSYRSLDSSGKAEMIRTHSLRRASAEEINIAMIELWQKLKPPSIETS